MRRWRLGGGNGEGGGRGGDGNGEAGGVEREMGQRLVDVV